MTNTIYRISVNYKSKVILLSKPLDECLYFYDKHNFIDETYDYYNTHVEVHNDYEAFRESHFVKSYKMAKMLFNHMKKTKKDYFFYNTIEE